MRKVKSFTRFKADILQLLMILSGKIKTIFIQSLLTVIAVSVWAIIVNSISSSGIPLITPLRIIKVGGTTVKIPVFRSRKQISESQPQMAYHAPDEIDLSSAYAHFQDYSAIFIDTRERDDYLKGHIARAISVPLDSLDFSREVLPGLSRSEKIITYCDGEECSQSIDLAVQLSEIGFSDVYFFYDGWTAWKKAGYPINVGDLP